MNTNRPPKQHYYIYSRQKADFITPKVKKIGLISFWTEYPQLI